MNIINSLKSSKINASNGKLEDNFILGKDEILLPKFTRIFGNTYTVNFYYFNSHRPELIIENSSINIYLPMNFRNKNNQKLINSILYKMYEKITEVEIENIFEKARHDFGFAPEDYDIRKIPGHIAKCDKNSQTITINPYISMYSKEQIEFIIYNEFCSLKFKNHSKSFYNLLSQFKPNYEKLSSSISNLKY